MVKTTRSHFDATTYGRRNILVQLGSSGELLSAAIDEALLGFESHAGFGTSQRVGLIFEM